MCGMDSFNSATSDMPNTQTLKAMKVTSSLFVLSNFSSGQFRASRQSWFNVILEFGECADPRLDTVTVTLSLPFITATMVVLFSRLGASEDCGVDDADVVTVTVTKE